MTTATTSVQPRTVNRGANPFAAMIKQQNAALTPIPTQHTVYESLQVRGDRVFADPRIQQALTDVKQRLAGQTYNQSHFGDLILAAYGNERYAKEITCNENIRK